MSFVSVAIGGGALASGVLGYMGATKAANTQAQAANNALSFQENSFNKTQANFTPYLNAGNNATYTLSNLLGLGPNGSTTTPDYSAFYNSPDYQFAQQQGNLALQRQAAANGQTLSGGTLKDIASYNSGLASQQYGNYFGRLMGIANMGANAASGAAGNGANFSGSIGNTMQGVGQAQASGIVGGTNALTGALNGGISNSLLASYLGKNPSAYNGAGTFGAAPTGSGANYSIGYGGINMPVFG